MNKLDENIIAMVEHGNSMAETSRMLGIKFQRVQQTMRPEKFATRKATAKAIKDGLLVRPDCCSDCKTPCKPDGHHPDYSQPLLVEWLCKTCHMKRHSKPKPVKEVIPDCTPEEISEGAKEMGRKGGLANTKRQQESRANNMRKRQAKRWPKENVTNSLTFGY